MIEGAPQPLLFPLLEAIPLAPLASLPIGLQQQKRQDDAIQPQQQPQGAQRLETLAGGPLHADLQRLQAIQLGHADGESQGAQRRGGQRPDGLEAVVLQRQRMAGDRLVRTAERAAQQQPAPGGRIAAAPGDQLQRQQMGLALDHGQEGARPQLPPLGNQVQQLPRPLRRQGFDPLAASVPVGARDGVATAVEHHHEGEAQERVAGVVALAVVRRIAPGRMQVRLVPGGPVAGFHLQVVDHGLQLLPHQPPDQLVAGALAADGMGPQDQAAGQCGGGDHR